MGVRNHIRQWLLINIGFIGYFNKIDVESPSPIPRITIKGASILYLLLKLGSSTGTEYNQFTREPPIIAIKVSRTILKD